MLEKWPGGTEEQKVGAEWPGPVKCVYTVRLRRVYGTCRGLEVEPGRGEPGSAPWLANVRACKASQNLCGAHGEIEAQTKGCREWEEGLKDSSGKFQVAATQRATGALADCECEFQG